MKRPGTLKEYIIACGLMEVLYIHTITHVISEVLRRGVPYTTATFRQLCLTFNRDRAYCHQSGTNAESVTAKAQ